MKPAIYMLTVVVTLGVVAAGLIAMRSVHKKGKTQGIVALAHDGPYSVLHGEREGHAFFAMINAGLANLPSNERLPFFLSISTPLKNPAGDGMAVREEANELNDWEDKLEARLGSRVKLEYVGRVTWNGHREIFYYVENEQAAKEALDSLDRDPSIRPFAFLCERDDKWEKASIWLDAISRTEAQPRKPLTSSESAP